MGYGEAVKEPRDYTEAALHAWSDIFPDVDLAAYATTVRIIRAGRILEASLDRVAREHGFDLQGDYEVLAALRRAYPTPLRPQDLAHRVMISAPGMTGRLDRLENAAYITRTPHPTDRRAILVEISPAGIAIADETFQGLIAAARVILEGFAISRRPGFNDELAAMLAIIGDEPRRP